MTIGSRLRMPVVIAATLVAYEGLFRGLRIDGVRPDPLLGVAVLAGLVAGSERGAVIGFACGVLADLFLPTPLGLSALEFCVAAYMVGALKATVLPSAPGASALTMFGASAGGVALYACLGALVGLPGTISTHLATIMAVVALSNVAMCAPLLRMVRWALEAERRDGSRDPSRRAVAAGFTGSGSSRPTGLTRR